jgi:hypothetical protein
MVIKSIDVYWVGSIQPFQSNPVNLSGLITITVLGKMVIKPIDVYWVGSIKPFQSTQWIYQVGLPLLFLGRW